MKPKPLDMRAADRELLERVSSGDPVAMHVIYDRYRKKVYSYILKIIKSADLAEDMLHEIFLKIWQHPDAGRIENLDHYLRVVTRNHTLKWLRRQQLEATANRRMFQGWNDAHRDTENAILLADMKRLLRQAVDRLPPRQKLVYRLCREEGLEYREAARKLAVSRLTVKKHMQLALRFLKNHLITHTDLAVWVIIFLFRYSS